MYKLSTKMDLLRRMRRRHEPAAIAMAALLFFSTLPGTARAQSNTYEGSTVVYCGTIGLVAGQTLEIFVPNVLMQDGSVRFIRSSIKVYDRDRNLLYQNDWSNEGQHEVGHLMGMAHGNVPGPGEARTGRKEVWIEI